MDVGKMARKLLKICRAHDPAHGVFSPTPLPLSPPSTSPSWGAFSLFAMVTQFELEGVIAACYGDAARAAAAATPTPTPTSAAVTLTVAEAITWRRRVMSCLVNTFVGRGNWRQALELLEDLGKEQCSSSSSRTSSTAAGGALRVELLSRVGRVFLQFGSLGDAEVYFRRAEKAAEAMGGTKEGNPRVSPPVRLVAVAVVFFMAGVGLDLFGMGSSRLFVLRARKGDVRLAPETMLPFCSFPWCEFRGNALAAGGGSDERP